MLKLRLFRFQRCLNLSVALQSGKLQEYLLKRGLRDGVIFDGELAPRLLHDAEHAPPRQPHVVDVVRADAQVGLTGTKV